MAPQLKKAFDASGMTLRQLIDAAGLDITVTSMSRKLSGGQPIGIDNGEADKLGGALGLGHLDWNRKGKTFAYVRKAS